MFLLHQARLTILPCMLLVLRGQSLRSFAFAPQRSRFTTQMSPSLSGEHTVSKSASTVGESDGISTMKQKAKLVAANPRSLTECGSRLRMGHLVSFPTETVYGLGCHALDPVAVQRVFDAKERPLSDPLIVHVVEAEQALELWDASSSNDKSQHLEKQALRVLTTTFFPGPLTIVARAKPSVPQIIMANTGYVACRSPSHPIARALISYAACPIAAPSANKFGHVSPTLASHVMDDLSEEDVWIVDPSLGSLDEIEKSSTDSIYDGSKDVCQVGVESTVAKVQIVSDNNDHFFGSICILRHGAISSNSIRDALKKANLDAHFEVRDGVQYTPENVNNVAPGQTVKHYSPHVPCFMLSLHKQQSTSAELSNEEKEILVKSAIIDYAGRLSQYKKYALAYRDLSPSGDAQVAAANVFETLRWTESVEGAIRVFVPDLSSEKNDKNDCEGHALVLAVKDKLTRAASGNIISVFR